jgi:hypothetical protein
MATDGFLPLSFRGSAPPPTYNKHNNNHDYKETSLTTTTATSISGSPSFVPYLLNLTERRDVISEEDVSYLTFLVIQGGLLGRPPLIPPLSFTDDLMDLLHTLYMFYTDSDHVPPILLLLLCTERCWRNKESKHPDGIIHPAETTIIMHPLLPHTPMHETKSAIPHHYCRIIMRWFFKVRGEFLAKFYFHFFGVLME